MPALILKMWKSYREWPGLSTRTGIKLALFLWAIVLVVGFTTSHSKGEAFASPFLTTKIDEK